MPILGNVSSGRYPIIRAGQNSPREIPWYSLLQDHTPRSSLFCAPFFPQPSEKVYLHRPTDLCLGAYRRNQVLGLSSFLAISPIPASVQAFPRSLLYIPQNRSENCVRNSLTIQPGSMIIGSLSHAKPRVFCDLIVLTILGSHRR